MNFKKYTANVFVIESDKKLNKGDIVEVSTKYGKLVECEVWNLVSELRGNFYYSYTRNDGENSQTFALRRAERAERIQANKSKKADEWYSKSKEGADFLSLGEPIKIGHHSEHRHRALIERNWARMGKSVKLRNEADSYDSKIDYWERKANEINLSMPECVEFYEYELIKAEDYHKGLKNGSIPVEHSYSVTYANKKVKDLRRKVRLSHLLWGDVA